MKNSVVELVGEIAGAVVAITGGFVVICLCVKAIQWALNLWG